MKTPTLMQTRAHSGQGTLPCPPRRTRISCFVAPRSEMENDPYPPTQIIQNLHSRGTLNLTPHRHIITHLQIQHEDLLTLVTKLNPTAGTRNSRTNSQIKVEINKIDSIDLMVVISGKTTVITCTNHTTINQLRNTLIMLKLVPTDHSLTHKGKFLSDHTCISTLDDLIPLNTHLGLKGGMDCKHDHEDPPQNNHQPTTHDHLQSRHPSVPPNNTQRNTPIDYTNLL